MSTFSAERSWRSLDGGAAAAGCASVGIGALAVLGWVARLPVFTRLLPEWSAMRLSTAFSFILCGVGLVGATRITTRRRRRVVLALGAVVASSGAFSFVECLAGATPWLDGALSALLQGRGAFPGRPSPISAFNFALAGLALLGLALDRPLVRLSQGCAVLMSISALLVLVVYAYGDIALHTIAPLSSMAAPSACGFLLLGAGVLCAWGARGPLHVFIGDGLGSVLARRTLPLALGLPLLAGWLTLTGDRLGLFQVEFAMALIALINVAISGVLTAAGGVWLNRIDAERAASEARLERSERHFRALAESLPQLVWTCEGSGHCDYLSPQWVEYTGVPERAQLGSAWLEQIHPADRQRVARSWLEAVAEASAFDTEFRIRRSDGTHRWFKTRATPLFSDGKLVKWFGSNTDIQDLRDAREVLEQLNQSLERRVAERTEELRQRRLELERSNHDLEQFAYVASHDLQEPLRAVAGCGQILKRRYGAGQLDAPAVELIDHMVEGAARMQALILDLLAYSRVAARGRELVGLASSEALRRAREQLDGVIEDAEIEVVGGELPRVLGDLEQLAQLFRNLMSNAIKYRGPRRAHIQISAEPRGEEWQFFVRDNGIGIEPQYFEKIFVLFQRLHTREEYPGTGIGLAICKKIVERHGGRIWVESVVGQGSVFQFTLPRERGAS